MTNTNKNRTTKSFTCPDEVALVPTLADLAPLCAATIAAANANPYVPGAYRRAATAESRAVTSYVHANFARGERGEAAYFSTVEKARALITAGIEVERRERAFAGNSISYRVGGIEWRVTRGGKPVGRWGGNLDRVAESANVTVDEVIAACERYHARNR